MCPTERKKKDSGYPVQPLDKPEIICQKKVYLKTFMC